MYVEYRSWLREEILSVAVSLGLFVGEGEMFFLGECICVCIDVVLDFIRGSLGIENLTTLGLEKFFIFYFCLNLSLEIEHKFDPNRNYIIGFRILIRQVDD